MYRVKNTLAATSGPPPFSSGACAIASAVAASSSGRGRLRCCCRPQPCCPSRPHRWLRRRLRCNFPPATVAILRGTPYIPCGVPSIALTPPPVASPLPPSSPLARTTRLPVPPPPLALPPRRQFARPCTCRHPHTRRVRR
jgi:hypothetical protein